MRSRSKRALERSSNKPKAVPRLNLWHGMFFVLGATVALIISILVPSRGVGSLNSKAMQVSRGAVSNAPWGDLEYMTIDLERPDESFPDAVPSPQPIIWWFPNLGQEQLEALLRQSQLSGEQLQALAEKSRWKAITNGWQIMPSVEVVRDLSLPARKAIYGVLRRSSLNFYIANPVRIPAAKFEEWVSHSGLTAEHQELLRRLCIPEGDMMNFYDGQLMEWLCTPAERKGLGKAAAQTSALLVKLNITPQTDIDALVKYWGRGSRGKSMRPFLESLARVPQGSSVSVSFFLPAFARMRLYTYPDSRNDRLAYHQDCFWTAMNFFNDAPDYRYFDSDQIQATLKKDYTRVSTNWTFGDVMMLVDEHQQAIHMCVYVADDIVFTKNGATFLAPWVLMKLPEMLRTYTAEKRVEIRTYRKKVV